MSETRTVFVPAITIGYKNHTLESVGIGGETFRRETPLDAENDRLKAENATLRGFVQGIAIENENLRELAREMYPYVGDTCPEECKYRYECEGDDNRGTDGFELTCVAYNHIGKRLRELRVEVER